jgi:hypothetical protein
MAHEDIGLFLLEGLGGFLNLLRSSLSGLLICWPLSDILGDSHPYNAIVGQSLATE